MSQKIVINRRYGGFGLTHEAMLRIAEIKGQTLYVEEREEFVGMNMRTYWLVPESERPKRPVCWASAPLEERQAYNAAYEAVVFCERRIPRDDPALVQTVEELGDKANERFADLKIIEIPSDVEWQIEEYDGMEWIAEKHRTWGDE